MPKEMRLLKLSLSNYRNIEKADFDFSGKSGKIVGSNRIGKTNVLEAIFWLLTDKLMGNSANVQAIKPLSDTSKTVSVEGVFDVDGQTLTIRKDFYEKWVRHHGESESTMEGHAEDYYVNGAKQGRALDFLASFAEKTGLPQDCRGVDVLQLICDPFYLPSVCLSIDWKKARAFIVDMAGDVIPAEVFAKCPASLVAKADLDRHQYDDGEAKKELKGQADDYSSKILRKQAVADQYSAVTGPTADELSYAKAKADEINAKIANAASGGTSAYDGKIADVSARLSELRKKQYESAKSAPIDRTWSMKLADEALSKSNELYSARNKRRDDSARKAILENKVADCAEKRKGYVAALNCVNEKIASYAPSENCPTCGQRLPAEQIESAKESFIGSLEAEGKAIMDKGIANKAEAEAAKKALDAINAEIASEDEAIERLQAEAAEAMGKRDGAAKSEEEKAQSSKPEADPAIQKEIDALEAELKAERGAKASAQSDSASKVAELRSELAPFSEVVAKKAVKDNAEAEAARAKAEKTALELRLADLEQRIEAVSMFVKTKLGLLDEHIAKVFGKIKFQLVRYNIRAGSYDEVCVPYIIDPKTGESTGTLWPEGSKSEQIFTGIAISKAVRAFKGWASLPVLFDEGGELDASTDSRIAEGNPESQFVSAKIDDAFPKPTFFARAK